jgi:CMP-N-acetylneuraminic acid synthetase
MKILIPARMGSKGFPGKNRILFDYTARIIPKDLSRNTVVSTDDPVIAEMAETYNFAVQHRPAELSKDETSTKDVVKSFLKQELVKDDTNLTALLYLTYPQRKWEDVIKAKELINISRSKSLLCAFDLEVHPFLMAFEQPNCRGKQIYKHNLYRRQDYPKCFEISHYVCMFHDDEVKNLNNNLYNEDTYFMKCDKKIDVDLLEHFQKYNEKN